MSEAVEQFLAGLPEPRRDDVRALRDEVARRLPAGFEERVAGGMIHYVVPHSLFPAGYHCDPKQPLGYAWISSTKGHISLHLMSLYFNADMRTWLESEFAKRGKRLDAGKACIRFKRLEDVPLDVLGAAIAKTTLSEYVARYESALAPKTAK